MRNRWLLVIATLGAPVFAWQGGAALANQSLTIETAPVQAEVTMQCLFDFECFETETCAESGFEATLSGKAGGLTESDMVVDVKMISDAETTPMLGVRSGAAMSLSGGSFDARALLTIGAEGAARYTLHLIDGPLALTYLGTCKEEG